jgi:hypothetical protein
MPFVIISSSVRSRSNTERIGTFRGRAQEDQAAIDGMIDEQRVQIAWSPIEGSRLKLECGSLNPQDQTRSPAPGRPGTGTRRWRIEIIAHYFDEER